MTVEGTRDGASTGEKIRRMMAGDDGSRPSAGSRMAQRVEKAREAKRKLSRHRRAR